jgi:Cytochrome c oxidase subunit IV
MAEGVKRPEEPAPPPGEAVHLPGPSYLPVLTALGIALALVGVVISWVVSAIGLVIAVIAVVRWIQETREDISELPLEH